jgi:hypothetical protein
MSLHNSTSLRTSLVPKDKQYPKCSCLGIIRVLNNVGKSWVSQTVDLKDLGTWFIRESFPYALKEPVGFPLWDLGNAIYRLFITDKNFDRMKR